jgi:hypothetical protein
MFQSEAIDKAVVGAGRLSQEPAPPEFVVFSEIDALPEAPEEQPASRSGVVTQVHRPPVSAEVANYVNR